MLERFELIVPLQNYALSSYTRHVGFIAHHRHVNTLTRTKLLKDVLHVLRLEPVSKPRTLDKHNYSLRCRVRRVEQTPTCVLPRLAPKQKPSAAAVAAAPTVLLVAVGEQDLPFAERIRENNSMQNKIGQTPLDGLLNGAMIATQDLPSCIFSNSAMIW